MEKIDVVVIGGGVVGLAIAGEISKKRSVAVIERNFGLGMESSSRNSGVNHSGIYYPPGSLKSALCLEGNRLNREICVKASLPYEDIGKLIISGKGEEMSELEKLMENGKRAGVKGLEILGKREIEKMEPKVYCEGALMCSSTGILDPERMVKYFEQVAIENETMIVKACEFLDVEDVAPFVIGLRDGNGKRETVCCESVVNSAGLHADKVAEKFGIDIDKTEYRLAYGKGEYFKIDGFRGQISRLVYPLPSSDLSHLGVHVTLDLDGEVRLGPNFLYVDEIDYSVDKSHAGQFYESASGFLKGLKREDVSLGYSGIRPIIASCVKNKFSDFIIVEETSKGLRGLINLIGINSPGLTAAPAIGRYVSRMIN